MARLLTEFLGTMFLVLIVGLVVASGTPLAPIAIGCGLMILVYAGGPISGAHYNPAVSVAILLRKFIAPKAAMQYIVAQLVGATAGAFISMYLTGKTFVPDTVPGVSVLAVLVSEVLFTGLLANVVLNVACNPAVKGNSYYGAAIGLTVLAAAFAAGPITGGTVNPAVAIGSHIVHAAKGGAFAPVWILIVGPMIGGALGAVVYGLQHDAPKSA